MANDVVTTSAPVLATVRNVELMHVGQWNIASGEAHFTQDDIVHAVAALDCPAVRRPVCKLGHDGNHGVGEPAIGYVDNMHVEDDYILAGDYRGLPSWLTEQNEDGDCILSSAFPDRSIEGEYDYVCQIGHTHPFVVHAVSWLGVERPGVGTLESLIDLFGAAPAVETTGTPVQIAAGEATMAKRVLARKGAAEAAVSTDDIRVAYYKDPDVPWSEWIQEIQLDPLQLITVDDNERKFYRVPITVNGDDFEFGAKVEVKQQFVDAGVVMATVIAGQRVIYASREESRPNVTATVETSNEVVTDDQEGAGQMDRTALLTALGLPADATDEAITTAVSDAGVQLPAATTSPAAGGQPTATTGKFTPPAGTVLVDETVWETTRQNAAAGAGAAEKLRIQERDTFLTAAAQAGRFPTARVEHYSKMYDADPDGTRQLIESFEPGLVPVAASAGHAAGEKTADDDGGDNYWFSGVPTPDVKG